MPTVKRWMRVLGPLVVMAMIVAACGGDDDDATTTAGEAAATTAAPGTTAASGTTDRHHGGAGNHGSDAARRWRSPGRDRSRARSCPSAPTSRCSRRPTTGHREAAGELGSDPAEFVGPADCGDATGQIEFMTNAVTQGVQAIMVSNNAGDELAPSAQAAADAGIPVVSWDSPIPSAEGESVFVAQVDFDETGQVMADMALNILGDDGGQFAILSATPEAANQNAWIAAMEEALAGPEYANLELVDTVYGNDVLEDSLAAAEALADDHPDLELIMAPTTVGIVAAAQAMTAAGGCEQVKVSGLGLPDEMAEYVESGCSPEFALWSFVDLGYLAYYVAYGIATGQIEAAEGQAFVAGRMGEYKITADPTRDAGLRVLMGPFTVYNADNSG